MHMSLPHYSSLPPLSIRPQTANVCLLMEKGLSIMLHKRKQAQKDSLVLGYVQVARLGSRVIAGFYCWCGLITIFPCSQWYSELTRIDDKRSVYAGSLTIWSTAPNQEKKLNTSFKKPHEAQYSLVFLVLLNNASFIYSPNLDIEN